LLLLALFFGGGGYVERPLRVLIRTYGVANIYIADVEDTGSELAGKEAAGIESLAW